MEWLTSGPLLWSLLTVSVVWHVLLIAATRRRTAFAGILSLPAVACQVLALGAVAWNVLGVPHMPYGPGTIIWLSADPGPSVAVMSILACCIQLGVVVVAHLIAPVGAQQRRSLDAAAIDRFGPVVVAAGFAALVLFVVVYGPANLLSRSGYLADFAVPRLSAYTGVLFLATVLAAVIATLARGWAGRLGWVLLLLLAVAAFSTASRVFAMLPLAYLLSRVLFRPGTSRVRLGAAGLTALLCFAASLANRGSATGHGLVPYLQNLQHPVDYLAPGFEQLIDDLVTVVPMLGAVRRTGEVTWQTMAVSMNPLPGTENDWSDLAPELRLHSFIPFSGFSELYSLGLPVLLGFGVLFGMLVAATVLTLAALLGTTGALVAAAPSYYAFVLLLQYNSRSSSKILYVLVVLLLAGLAVRFWRRRPAPAPRLLGLTTKAG